MSIHISYQSRTIRDKHKARLYADLHLLVSSGLDINSTFNILSEQSKGERGKKRFEQVRKDIVSGMSLAEAMHKGGLAGNYEYYSMTIGEESGKLEEVLFEICRYYERKVKQKRVVSGAMTYPVLVLATAMIAVGFMLNVIVPMFEEVFDRFQGELPALTRRIIEASDWFKQHGWLLLPGLVTLFMAIWIGKKNRKILRRWHRLLLAIPLIGKLVKDIESARFCHIMALLMSARSPLVQSLAMVENVIWFSPLKDAVSSITKGIEEGRTFHDSLERTGFFDRKFTSLIRAGEEVNKMEYAFNRLNEQYNQKIEHQLTILTSLMEPLLIILVGGIVGVILVSMYLPLFQIGSSIY
jgi:type IV pilus assembly protein PilC